MMDSHLPRPIDMDPLFWIGVGLGVMLTVPLAWVYARRTERRVRRLEQRARAAERLAELGTLTGGLAHEIKNPLSTIGLNVQLIREDLDALAPEIEGHGGAGAGAGSDAATKLGRIGRRFDSLGREVRRLREILEDFLRFAGRMKLDRQPCDLVELAEELADFFQPQAQAAGVRLHVHRPGWPVVASVDRGLVKQAMLNLMINAVQAMSEARESAGPHGGCGELILRVERVGRSGAGVGSSSGKGTEEARVHVIDTGPGMDAQRRAKVFTPYFSTKKGGTGLGLPTARRIAEEHGGELSVLSEPGRGSDFVLSLPTG